MLLSSLKDLTVLSIHPKQRASSTASLYRMRFFPVFFKGYCSHTASAVSKLASSHFRQSFRSTKYLITISFIVSGVAKGLLLHGFRLEFFGHFFDGVAQGGTWHKGFFSCHIVEHGLLPAFAGCFKHPAIAFLHQVVGVEQQKVCNLKYFFEKQTFSGGDDQAYGGPSFGPTMRRGRPSLQFLNVLGILHHKASNGVVAKGVAVGPIVYVGTYPALKGLEIFRLVFFFTPFGKATGNKSLFKVSRLPQFFAKGKDFLPGAGHNLGAASLGYLIYPGSFYAVNLGCFAGLKEATGSGLCLWIGAIGQRLSDFGQQFFFHRGTHKKTGILLLIAQYFLPVKNLFVGDVVNLNYRTYIIKAFTFCVFVQRRIDLQNAEKHRQFAFVGELCNHGVAVGQIL